jgi:NAD(P)-dependent dehydrogenase (short-subunit alcohol dehydrogenase family)
VRIFQADLLDMQELQLLTDFAKQAWGGIDVLVNNASAFYATDLTEVTEDQWDELLGSNLKSPLAISSVLPVLCKATLALISFFCCSSISWSGHKIAPGAIAFILISGASSFARILVKAAKLKSPYKAPATRMILPKRSGI